MAFDLLVSSRKRRLEPLGVTFMSASTNDPEQCANRSRKRHGSIAKWRDGESSCR